MNSENLLEKPLFQKAFSEFELGEFAGKALLPVRILRVQTRRICWESHASREDSLSLNFENLMEKLRFQKGFSEFELGEFAGKAMPPGQRGQRRSQRRPRGRRGRCGRRMTDVVEVGEINKVNALEFNDDDEGCEFNG